MHNPIGGVEAFRLNVPERGRYISGCAGNGQIEAFELTVGQFVRMHPALS